MIEQLTVKYHDQTVGQLLIGKDSLCRFEYSSDWLKTGFSISPFELPLQNRVFTASPGPFEGNFGVFDDSLPDGWGLLILDRLLRKRGINPQGLNILDRLSIVGANGRGALEYYPVHTLANEELLSDLDKLAQEAKALLNDEDYNEGVGEFQYRGGSPGGARPKIFTRFDGREWLVKFPARQDPENIGKTEFEYSLLAKSCGIDMPETRLFNDKYFGVERFDRQPDGEKIHTVSVAGLLRADYRLPSIDYLHIFRVATALTRDMEELWKIFRLMAFNFLIGNKDDHAKNFAFIFKEGRWKFSPAFDLLPSHGFNGFHTTTVNDSVNPVPEDLIEVAAKVGLDKSEASSLLQSLRSFYTGRR